MQTFQCSIVEYINIKFKIIKENTIIAPMKEFYNIHKF